MVTKMVKIRRIDKEKGDKTVTVTLEEAVVEVEKAIDEGFLVVDETEQERRAIRNALGLKEESVLTFHRPVGGG